MSQLLQGCEISHSFAADNGLKMEKQCNEELWKIIIVYGKNLTKLTLAYITCLKLIFSGTLCKKKHCRTSSICIIFEDIFTYCAAACADGS